MGRWPKPESDGDSARRVAVRGDEAKVSTAPKTATKKRVVLAGAWGSVDKEWVKDDEGLKALQSGVGVMCWHRLTTTRVRTGHGMATRGDLRVLRTWPESRQGDEGRGDIPQPWFPPETISWNAGLNFSE